MSGGVSVAENDAVSITYCQLALAASNDEWDNVSPNTGSTTPGRAARRPYCHVRHLVLQLDRCPAAATSITNITVPAADSHIRLVNLGRKSFLHWNV